uniref:protein C-mannosyl-transferase DPY19L1 n=1 Tax=Myxine glutinosa TaxID=7769 RepID=UPI00358FBEB5
MGGTSRGSRQRAGRDVPSSGSQAGNRRKTGGSSRTTVRQRSAEHATRTRISRSDLNWRNLSHWTIALLVAFLHWYHISSLFENDRHFSHLSSLERELTFRTEMGLYYSYYKTIAEAPRFLSGLERIMRDNLTEFPQVINTLERFNLYPEVLLSAWYRVFIAISDTFGISTTQCWTVKRGDGLDSVESCEGMGDLAYFYVNMVFVLNGMMMAVFYLFGAYLSGSRLGGVVTVACFFFNHGEGTRVMWTPPLRESFSYPFLVLQMLLVTCVLRCPAPKMRILVMLVLATLFFMLPWQFSQFVMLVQISCLFAVHVMGYISTKKMKTFLCVHMLSLGLCFLLMFGNKMLLTSFYAASLLSIWIVVHIRDWLRGVCVYGFLTWLVQGAMWLAGTFLVKGLLAVLLQGTDDAHIFNLLKSKLSDYQDFDTQLYSCAPEFDYLERKILFRFSKTLLLPTVVIVFLMISCKIIRNKTKLFGDQLWPSWMANEMWDCDEGSEQHENELHDTAEQDDGEDAVYAELLFHTFTLIAFAIMAILIMRLKLFLTPHMCLMASLVCFRQFAPKGSRRWVQHAVVMALLGMMAWKGSQNVRAQWAILGEFSNLPQEELIEWIRDYTAPDAVFAGAMPTMASVKLSAERPIVNHPHYEDAGLRARTKLVYMLYSRKNEEDVWRAMKQLGVHYLILEDSWCTRRTRPGCSLPEIWDIEDMDNRGRVPVCTRLASDPGPYFFVEFQNYVYAVLRVKRSI